MANVGSININLTAGTAQLTPALNAATGQLRQLGGAAGGAGGAMRAAGAEANLFEKGIIANTRSMDAFLISTLKLGPLIQAAFPVFGALALGAVLVDLTKKVVEYIKAQEEGPKKAAKAFDGLTQSLRLQDDELKVANARLEDQIAKLEGKPQNFLKLALEEDALAADKLGEHLAAANEKAKKVLEENKPGFLQSAAALQSSVDIGASWNPGNLEKRTAADQTALDKLNIIRGQRTDAIRIDPKLNDKQRLEQEEQVARDTAEGELAIYTKTQKWLADQKKLADHLIEMMGPVRNMSIQEREARSYLALYSKSAEGLMNNNLHEQAYAYDQLRNTGLIGNMAGAEADHTAAEEAKKDQEQINKLIAERAKASEGELSILDQIHARMQERLREETEAYNKNHPELGGNAALPNKQITIINQTEQAELGAAGTKITEELWRGLIAQRAKVKEESLTAIQKIDIEENESFEQLAARMAGRGTQPVDIPQGVSPADYQKQTYDMARDDARMKSWHKYVEQQEKDDKEIAELEDKDAREVAERRKKALEELNHLDEIRFKSQEGTINRQASLQEHIISMTTEGEDKINKLYQERIKLAQQVEALYDDRIAQAEKENQDKKTIDDLKAERDAAVQKAKEEAQDDRLKSQVDQYDQKFKEMTQPIENGLADQITKSMTGQKTDWKLMFQEVGRDMLKQQIQKQLDSLFKRGESALLPLFVKDVDRASGVPGAGGSGTGSAPSSVGKQVLDALGLGGLIKSKTPNGAGNYERPDGLAPGVMGTGNGFTYMASGGDVSPGSMYVVGEHAPEYFMPKTSGRIVPGDKMGGGNTYNINASNAQIGVENRIAQAIDLSHQSAILTTMRAQQDRMARTPLRSANN